MISNIIRTSHRGISDENAIPKYVFSKYYLSPFCFQLLFDKSHLFADLLDLLVLALVELNLVFLKKIIALYIDGHDQRTKLFDTAVPKCFRHSEISPLGRHNLLDLRCSHNRISCRENTVDGTEFLAGTLRIFLHSALADIKAGDIIYLNGSMTTCRDVAHRRLVEEGRELPVDVRNNAIFHAGPIIRPLENDKFEMVSVGPTTSMRMEKFEYELVCIRHTFVKRELLKNDVHAVCGLDCQIGG